ncbi:MAG: CoA transferase, partial [Gammaproteobacteria bacterium]|nr:CoA transferase [Gammaproteobacteria bacterium]
LENPYLHDIGMVQHLPHPALAAHRVLANPIKLDGERLPSRLAPALGQDTDDVLRELGYDQAALEDLRRSGVT